MVFRILLRPCRRESKKLLMKLNVRLLCHSVKCLIREILNKWYSRLFLLLLYWRYLLLLRRQLPTAAKLNFFLRSSSCMSAHKGDCTKNWQMKTIKSKVTSMNKFSVGRIVENSPKKINGEVFKLHSSPLTSRAQFISFFFLSPEMVHIVFVVSPRNVFRPVRFAKGICSATKYAQWVECVFTAQHLLEAKTLNLVLFFLHLDSFLVVTGWHRCSMVWSPSSQLKQKWLRPSMTTTNWTH